MAKTFRPLNANQPLDDRNRPSDDHDVGMAAARDLAGAAEFMAAGFEPLEELTGVSWIGEQWPDDHRRSLPETRPENLALDEEVVWFVRSPWPSLTPAQVISLVWARLPRDDESIWPEKSRDVLSWSESRARDAYAAESL